MNFNSLSEITRKIPGVVLHNNLAFIVAAMLGALLVVSIFKSTAPFTFGVRYSDGHWGALMVVAIGFPLFATAVSDFALRPKTDPNIASSFTALGLSLTALASVFERLVAIFTQSNSDVLQFANSTLLGLALAPSGLNSDTLIGYEVAIVIGTIATTTCVCFAANHIRQLDFGRLDPSLISPLLLLLIASALVTWSLLTNTDWMGTAEPIPAANIKNSDSELWKLVVRIQLLVCSLLAPSLVVGLTAYLARSPATLLTLTAFLLRTAALALLILAAASLIAAFLIAIFVGIPVASNFVIGIGAAILGWILVSIDAVWVASRESVERWIRITQYLPTTQIALGVLGVAILRWLHEENPVGGSLRNLSHHLATYFENEADWQLRATHDPDVLHQTDVVTILENVRGQVAQTSGALAGHYVRIPPSQRPLALTALCCALLFPSYIGILVAIALRPVEPPRTIDFAFSVRIPYQLPEDYQTATVLENLPISCFVDLAGSEVYWAYRSDQSFVLQRNTCSLPDLPSPQYVIAIGAASSDDLAGAGYRRSQQRGQSLTAWARAHYPESEMIVVALGRERSDGESIPRDADLFQDGRPVQLLVSANTTQMPINHLPVRTTIQEYLIREGVLDRYEYCVLLRDGRETRSPIAPTQTGRTSCTWG